MSAQTFARGYKTVFSWGKIYVDFLMLFQKIFYIILRTMILAALVNSGTGIEISAVQKQPPAVLLNSNQSFTKFTGKHLCQCLFFNKVAGLRPATLLKSRLRLHHQSSWNFVKFLRIPFWKATVSQNMKAISYNLQAL